MCKQRGKKRSWSKENGNYWEWVDNFSFRSFPSGINLLQLGTLFGKVRTWICTPVLWAKLLSQSVPSNFCNIFNSELIIIMGEVKDTLFDTVLDYWIYILCTINVAYLVIMSGRKIFKRSPWETVKNERISLVEIENFERFICVCCYLLIGCYNVETGM